MDESGMATHGGKVGPQDWQLFSIYPSQNEGSLLYIILNHTQISTDVWPKLVIGKRPHWNWVTSRDGIRCSSCYGVCTGKVMTCQTSGRAPRHTLWMRTIVDQLDWNNEKPQTHRRFLQLYNSLPLALGEAEAWPHATYAGQCNPKNLSWLMGPCAVLGSGSHIQRGQADRGPKAGYFFGEARWSPNLTDFSNDPNVCLEPSWAYFALLGRRQQEFLAAYRLW